MRKLFRKFTRWMYYNPPGALSSEGWSLFRKEFKRVAPIRYWFSHTGRRKYYLPIIWKYTAIRDFILYRTTRRYHVVKTGLPPGYSDVRSKMLHTNFTMLVDFVEVETGWHYYICNMEERVSATWAQKHLPFFRWSFRRPDLGIKHYEWAATLDDPKLPPHERCDHQAVAAREILFLYDWWVNKRPARKEVEIPRLRCDDDDEDDIFDIFNSNRNSPEHKAYREALDRMNEREEEWDKEDEEMLIRLIKIRHSLWT